MTRNIRCTECGYLFGFCIKGLDLANKEFDPEVLRKMHPDQMGEVSPHNHITFRNYVWQFESLHGDTWDEVRPYRWTDCDFVGCFRHQFPNIRVGGIEYEEDEFGALKPFFDADTSEVAGITHIERDCDFYIPYRIGLSARRHEELEQQFLFEQERAYAQWNKQLRQVFCGFLDRVRQATTNNEKKQSLEYLAEFLFGTIKGLQVIDRNLRTSAEEIDRLVRNESDEAFWSSLGNPLLVECKNWGVAAGAKEIRDLGGKMGSRSIRTAFLIAKSGVSGNDYRDARLEIRQALGNGKYIIVLSDTDLQEIAEGLPPLEKFRDKYEDLFRI
jgi:hypothetical protein